MVLIAIKLNSYMDELRCELVEKGSVQDCIIISYPAKTIVLEKQKPQSTDSFSTFGPLDTIIQLFMDMHCLPG